MKFIATDLDGTLIQNGTKKKDPKAYTKFSSLLRKNSVSLIFVTGRRIQMVQHALRTYPIPIPKYAICSVGTKIYEFKNKNPVLFQPYQSYLAKEWDETTIQTITNKLQNCSYVRPQSPVNQNEFKTSYFVDAKDMKKAVTLVKKKLKNISAHIVDSQKGELGFIDIMPTRATKLGALEFLRKYLHVTKKNILYCGDSGNDLQPMLANYPSVIVQNATDELKNRVKQRKNIYVAKKIETQNGYYTNGIIQGAKFKRFFE